MFSLLPSLRNEEVENELIGDVVTRHQRAGTGWLSSLW